ncbi:hypothetical protein VTJ04DRAFT_1284 [Mycothermus thermophilus]|uniref:uncharacterized protein n=1 Tax=Humicola insolens TaxID=85995 RepID=UPI003742B3B5
MGMGILITAKSHLCTRSPWQGAAEPQLPVSQDIPKPVVALPSPNQVLLDAVRPLEWHRQSHKAEDEDMPQSRHCKLQALEAWKAGQGFYAPRGFTVRRHAFTRRRLYIDLPRDLTRVTYKAGSVGESAS